MTHNQFNKYYINGCMHYENTITEQTFMCY